MMYMERFTFCRSKVIFGATSLIFSDCTRFGTLSTQSTVLFCSARYCSAGLMATGEAPIAVTCALCQRPAARTLRPAQSAGTFRCLSRQATSTSKLGCSHNSSTPPFLNNPASVGCTPPYDFTSVSGSFGMPPSASR